MLKCATECSCVVHATPRPGPCQGARAGTAGTRCGDDQVEAVTSPLAAAVAALVPVAPAVVSVRVADSVVGPAAFVFLTSNRSVAVGVPPGGVNVVLTAVP